MSYTEKKKKLMRSRENGFLCIALIVMQITLLITKVLGADISWFAVLMPLMVGVVAFMLYGLWLIVSVIWIALQSYDEEETTLSGSPLKGED